MLAAALLLIISLTSAAATMLRCHLCHYCFDAAMPMPSHANYATLPRHAYADDAMLFSLFDTAADAYASFRYVMPLSSP